MKNGSEYDLIYDYPYENIDEKFGFEFLQKVNEPADIKAAGKDLEARMRPYIDGMKANQIDIALAVREVLNLPFYGDNKELRKKTRELITNFVKNSADANGGKVIGEEVIKLFLQYKGH